MAEEFLPLPSDFFAPDADQAFMLAVSPKWDMVEGAMPISGRHLNKRAGRLVAGR
jgi:hypothetical protein